MLAAKQQLILQRVEEGTGAAIRLEEDNNGLQAGLKLSFADLARSHSPIVTLRPAGLRRFRATLSFGPFASDTIEQMMRANDEEVQLARALVASIAKSAVVTFGGGQTIEDWLVGDGFTLTAEKRDITERFDDDTLSVTCRDLVIPILAAMAELYGYDPVEEALPPEDQMEGTLTLALVRRRERNPRNRLLALRIHGAACKVCRADLEERYGDAGGIIEVHHLQPISLLLEPRAYDPAMDLIPLCPNCHRAVHTRAPVPWTPDELGGMLHLA